MAAFHGRCTFLLVSIVVSATSAPSPECIADESSVRALLHEEDLGHISLLQTQALKSSHGHKPEEKKNTTTVQNMAMDATTATTAWNFTTSTTTTTYYGPNYLIMSSSTTAAIYSWDFMTSEPSLLIENAGLNPTGIALDLNFGYVYYTDPVARMIVRYELSISDGQVALYDDQPVPIAMNVDADWIAVNEFSNIFWTDPVDHSIKKMYKVTIDRIAQGIIQPNQLTTVSYMDIYLQTGRVVPSDCYKTNANDFPLNCTANITCYTCQELYEQPYIYTLYSDMGWPSGMQVQPGNRMLWGNRVDGFKRGTVVEAENEPTLAPGQEKFNITAKSYLWDSVFDFYQFPDTATGQDILMLTTNGTLGIPPIPGDVTGALVGINPPSSNGPSEATILDWNFDRPRGIAWNGEEKAYVADNWGVTLINSNMMITGTPEARVIALPGAAGLVRLANGDPCYPLMVARGSQPIPPSFGLF